MVLIRQLPSSCSIAKKRTLGKTTGYITFLFLVTLRYFFFSFSLHDYILSPSHQQSTKGNIGNIKKVILIITHTKLHPTCGIHLWKNAGKVDWTYKIQNIIKNLHPDTHTSLGVHSLYNIIRFSEAMPLLACLLAIGGIWELQCEKMYERLMKCWTYQWWTYQREAALDGVCSSFLALAWPNFNQLKSKAKMWIP